MAAPQFLSGPKPLEELLFFESSIEPQLKTKTCFLANLKSTEALRSFAATFQIVAMWIPVALMIHDTIRANNLSEY